MFHKSHIGEHGERFPADLKGHVPVHGDCWRRMHFDHGELDPEEPGISEEERARRITYLDKVWWPQVLEKVHAERLLLEAEHGPTFMERWDEVAHQGPPMPHGFEA